MRPLFLLSNDDGVNAIGLRTLREALSSVGDVAVCAPSVEQSGTSHAITLNRPLRLVEQESGIFSVDGTPADCVYVAVNATNRVLPRRPDVVISGLNHGMNLGNDVFYSGTVAAAREGALRGIPGLAVSASARTDRKAASEVAAQIALKLVQSRGTTLLLNVNFPAGNRWPLQVTRLGTRRYSDSVEFRTDPRGGEYLWIGTGEVIHDKDAGTDTWAFDQGIVGLTPLSLELWGSGQAAIAEVLVNEMQRPG
ncbi:MAG TPA: 5'/3'-nucleotidase SurE [Polyangiaceae bacterium]|nr:5'/3'-nucleotidase SurE [Polyangiaceae bacterium]